MCGREATIDQFLLRSLPRKILWIIKNLERTELRHIQKQSKIVRTSNSGGKILEQLKALNVLKEENLVFNRTVGIGIKSIYARLTENELLGSDVLSSLPRLCTDTSTSQNQSSYRNVSANLDVDD